MRPTGCSPGRCPALHSLTPSTPPGPSASSPCSHDAVVALLAERYLDVVELGVAPVEGDLAAAVWGLQYNLGAGWGAPFLRTYGWASDAETVKALRRSYETGAMP
jgi:hypothetical protein